MYITLHLRHNTLPRRLPAAKRRGFKAHRRHGSAGLFNLVRNHRRPARDDRDRAGRAVSRRAVRSDRPVTATEPVP